MYGEKSINNPRVTPKQQVYKTEDHGNWTELWTEEFYQHSDQIVPGHIFVTIALTAHLASIFHTLEYLPVKTFESYEQEGLKGTDWRLALHLEEIIELCNI